MLALGAPGQVTNFFNWETAPVHPAAISPDSSTLAICNLPDNRLELFDITSGKPLATTNIPVGLDPVTVRFRTASEIWVANYISDSISIIDLPTRRVLSTITTSNEPSDIVFAGNPQRAYVSCGQPNLVQVYNPGTFQLVTNIVIDGNRPRALGVSPDGSKVYVAIFESGNASTIIGTGISAGFP
ncbi:MAG TPA: YncE family protein, partial [Methylomirabilota bacterium]|nr:YncE family protein [Methylomirabilota bacterium]